MQALPTPDQRLWLVDCLGALIHQRGVAPLMETPLRTPSDDVFSVLDRARSADALQTVLRHLLRHVGLDTATLMLVNESTMIPGEGEVRFDASIGPGGFVARELASPLPTAVLLGALAREVTRAYRAHHGLVYPHPKAESRLSDLTAVFVGLGALTSHTITHVSSLRWDGLSSIEVGFALAIQLRVRRLNWIQRRRLSKALPTSTRRAMRDAYRLLAKPESLLEARLGLQDMPPLPSSGPLSTR